jgi:hypothetical protein
VPASSVDGVSVCISHVCMKTLVYCWEREDVGVWCVDCGKKGSDRPALPDSRESIGLAFVCIEVICIE